MFFKTFILVTTKKEIADDFVQQTFAKVPCLLKDQKYSKNRYLSL